MILINLGGPIIPIPTPDNGGDDGGNLGPGAVVFVLAILCIIGTILIINS